MSEPKKMRFQRRKHSFFYENRNFYFRIQGADKNKKLGGFSITSRRKMKMATAKKAAKKTAAKKAPAKKAAVKKPAAKKAVA